MPLDPRGVVLGRSENCEVTLDHANVSRQHARISQDPFGRWIVEDLDSHNGILVEGQRVKAQAVLPDQEISIRPFTLRLSEELDRQTALEHRSGRHWRLLTKVWKKTSYRTDQASWSLYPRT
jgi:pSer/pThr/pTyr-binding forkhead associated (FHA) protein